MKTKLYLFFHLYSLNSSNSSKYIAMSYYNWKITSNKVQMKATYS